MNRREYYERLCYDVLEVILLFIPGRDRGRVELVSKEFRRISIREDFRLWRMEFLKNEREIEFPRIIKEIKRRIAASHHKSLYWKKLAMTYSSVINHIEFENDQIIESQYWQGKLIRYDILVPSFNRRGKLYRRYCRFEIDSNKPILANIKDETRIEVEFNGFSSYRYGGIHVSENIRIIPDSQYIDFSIKPYERRSSIIDFYIFFEKKNVFWENCYVKEVTLDKFKIYAGGYEIDVVHNKFSNMKNEDEELKEERRMPEVNSVVDVVGRVEMDEKKGPYLVLEGFQIKPLQFIYVVSNLMNFFSFAFYIALCVLMDRIFTDSEEMENGYKFLDDEVDPMEFLLSFVFVFFIVEDFVISRICWVIRMAWRSRMKKKRRMKMMKSRRFVKVSDFVSDLEEWIYLDF